MAKVKRSTAAPAKGRKSASAAAATPAPKKGSAEEAAAAATVTPAAKEGPKEAEAAPCVIEIASSPDRSASNGAKRKRPAPRPFVLDDEVQMWTPRQKRRVDEDCQILAADPFKAAEVAPAPAAAANDDIAVVAETGKVACRDYPHPRSACAKHPFNTTAHERHCDKCFCYVCDVAAPCVAWKGHCHASDKEKQWKHMRLAKKKATQASSNPSRL